MMFPPRVGRSLSPIRVVARLLALMLPWCAGAQEKVVNVYGWEDYRDPAALQKFTAETGIAVRYDTYDDLPMLEAVMALGHSGHDIVMPTNEPTLSRLVTSGVLAPIDRALVPNWRNLDPDLMRRIESSDPGNRHGALFLWGTLGLGILPDKIRALAPDAPQDSLDLMLRPQYAKRLQACGITMLDSPTVVIPAVLSHLGISPDSLGKDDLARVAETLANIRSTINTFSNSSALATLADGSTCVALAYSGNVLQAAQRAATAKNGVTVRYVVPKTGAEVTYDVLAIPVDAPHKPAAHAFINFMLRPDVIAGVTNVTRYANGVPASHKMIDPALLADTNVFPTPAQMATFFTPGPVPVAAKLARNRMWSHFKDAR